MSFHVCTDLRVDHRLRPRIAVDRSVVWYPGQVITISFVGGTDFQKNKVMDIAVEWLDYANIDFSWIYTKENPRANVRISFQRGKGSWSYLGQDALLIDGGKPTMNFGWLFDNTPDEEWNRVVLHEFGHMLGAIHEHQSPAVGIKWDKPLVYQYYWQTQGWSREQVDFNIFRKYDENISNTEFDRESIMLYPVEQRFTLDQFEVGWNRSLSDTDKRFMREMYP